MASKTVPLISSENNSRTSQNGKRFVENVSESAPRKTLQTLQLSSLGENRLTGKNGTKEEANKNKKIAPSTERVKVYEDTTCNLEDHSTQTDDTTSDDSVANLTEADREALELMGGDTAPEGYWQLLAEERRKALNDTLEENEQLHKEVDSLKEENEKLSELASKAEYLSSFLESVIASTSDEDSNSADDEEYKTGDEGKDEEETSETENCELETENPDNRDTVEVCQGSVNENDIFTDCALSDGADTYIKQSFDFRGASNLRSFSGEEVGHSFEMPLQSTPSREGNNRSKKKEIPNEPCSRFSEEWVNVELDDDKVASTEVIKGTFIASMKDSS